MMDERIHSTAYVEVLRKPINFPLSVRPSKETPGRPHELKKSLPSAGIDKLCDKFNEFMLALICQVLVEENQIHSP